MAHRRWLGALARSILSPQTLNLPKTLTLPSFAAVRDLHSNPPIPPLGFPCVDPLRSIRARKLSYRPSDASSGEDDDDDDDDDEEYDGEEEEGEDGGDAGASKRVVQSGKTEEEKVKEAEGIGYKVVGPLDESERPFKRREPVFAVVQIGSHQFKVSNGDSIFTERLKFCEVNDKLILKKVLVLGSKTQTIIGRPILPDSAVHAVVEEHALDAKVIIFKKKRRKNYRRTNGHRQELTKLRITDIQGIDKVGKAAIAA